MSKKKAAGIKLVLIFLAIFLYLGARFVFAGTYEGEILSVTKQYSRSDAHWVVRVKTNNRIAALTNRDLPFIRKQTVAKVNADLQVGRYYQIKTIGLDEITFHPTITFVKKVK